MHTQCRTLHSYGLFSLIVCVCVVCVQSAGALQEAQVPGQDGGELCVSGGASPGAPAGLQDHHARREQGEPYELHRQRAGATHTHTLSTRLPFSHTHTHTHTHAHCLHNYLSLSQTHTHTQAIYCYPLSTKVNQELFRSWC